MKFRKEQEGEGNETGHVTTELLATQLPTVASAVLQQLGTAQVYWAGS